MLISSTGFCLARTADAVQQHIRGINQFRAPYGNFFLRLGQRILQGILFTAFGNRRKRDRFILFLQHDPAEGYAFAAIPSPASFVEVFSVCIQTSWTLHNKRPPHCVYIREKVCFSLFIYDSPFFFCCSSLFLMKEEIIRFHRISF